MRASTCRLFGGLLLIASLGAGGPAIGAGNGAELAAQVRAAEAAFARSMAERDHEAFAAHLAEETIFFSNQGVLRGKSAVAAAWKKYYEGPSAPFSWQPDSVEVLDSGTLAHSSGPVFAPDGRRIATFNSVWRRESDGRWRIIFDKGYPYRE